jgi:hypothetical protein
VSRQIEVEDFGPERGICVMDLHIGIERIDSTFSVPPSAVPLMTTL